MIDAAALAGLNHLLRGANWARVRLAPYADRHACFVMPPLSLVFAVGTDGYLTAAQADAPIDVAIHLPADTPFQLVHGLDKAMASARVEGNAEFATALSFVLRNLRWDAEEDLARLVGDIPARRLVQGAQDFAGWQKQAVRNLGDNLAEYLVHESRMLVSTPEFVALREGIDRLGAGLDGIEARLPPRR